MAEEQTRIILKRKRDILKGQLSKFVTYINKFNEASNVEELSLRIGRAEALWSEFDNIQTELELADDTGTEAGHCDIFEATYPVLNRAMWLKRTTQTTPDAQPQTNYR